jgi:carbonic anhydrase
MFGTNSKLRKTRGGARKATPRCESLESRTVLSAFVAPAGTISGAVINEATGLPIPKVQIQLINSAGRVVGKTMTNAAGLYLFNVKFAGAYVVREATPKGFFQITPSFANAAPVGSFNTATAGTTAASQSASWNYGFGTDPAAGPVGPFAWDTVAPAADEPFQSPINITTKPTNLAAILSVNYNAMTPSKTINNGHQIQVQFPTSNPADTISLVGATYDLSQFHFHSPSETTVNGQHFLAEEHFVNTNPVTGAETVVAVFLKLGAHNNALQPILDAATASLAKSGSSTTSVGAIDFSGLLPSNPMGWFYKGSLTTPPVSQPVNWLVFATPITVDANQAAQYQAVAASGGFLPNARPSQPTDGRVINELDYQIVFGGDGLAGENFQVTPI